MSESFLISTEKSFIDAFGTPKGSVIGNYEYGTKAHLLKHRSYNTGFVIDAKRACKDACEFDPRLNFQEAILDSSSIQTGKILFDVNIGTGRNVLLHVGGVE